jgi:hypothetical protein
MSSRAGLKLRNVEIPAKTSSKMAQHLNELALFLCSTFFSSYIMCNMSSFVIQESFVGIAL